MSGCILGIPQVICAYQVLRQDVLRGFLLGVGSIVALIIAGYILLSLPLFPECELDTINCEWIPLTFILWVVICGVSVFSLIPSALLFNFVHRKLSKERHVQTAWGRFAVAFVSTPAMALSSYLLLYPFSFGMLLERIVVAITASEFLGYILGFAIIITANGVTSALAFAFAYYGFASKLPTPDQMD